MKKNKASEKVADYLEKLNIPRENIPGTEASIKVTEDMREGGEVLEQWQDGESLYDELLNKIEGYREFYLGDVVEQGVSNLEGDVSIIANLGATVIDLFVYILSNNPPSVQFIPTDTNPMSVTEASFKEDLVEQMLSDANFHKRFRSGARNQFKYGWCWLYPFWNTSKKDSGKKGTFDIASLNLFTTRVQHKGDDAEQIQSFITTNRLTQKRIRDTYNVEAFPDSEDPVIPKTWETENDNKTTVFRWYGENEIKVVIGGRVVKRIKHKLGFTPLVQINNIEVSNDIHGHSEIERWQGIVKEVNALLSATSEIARDLAYPPLLEYNNALGNRKIPKWRGQKIPVRRSQKGEALEYLINAAQIAPLIEQTKQLIQLFHFISLMPEAAGGMFPANITSGFQAKLAMQPTTLKASSSKIDWVWAIKELVKMGFKILERYNPDALIINKGTEAEIKVSGIHNHEMKVIWPENLPMDIAREIQNLVLGIQNNLTSVTQAIDRYNALLGFGSPADTKDYLKQEAEDSGINPERALKVAQVKEKLQQMQTNLQESNQKVSELRGKMNSQPDQIRESQRQNNPTNLLRSAASKLPEERKRTPPTAREAVVPQSTGGRTITPERI